MTQMKILQRQVAILSTANFLLRVNLLKMQMVEKICLEKKQEFTNVSLGRNTVAWRVEEILSDIKRQLEAIGVLLFS